jgi:SAM-dependent methyltransferase
VSTFIVHSGEAHILRTFLQRLGYGDNLIRESFPIWLGRSVETVDFACFGRPLPMDMTTSTIIGRTLPAGSPIETTIDAARAIACPAVAVAFPDILELWSINAHPGTATKVASVGTEEVGRLATDFHTELGPDPLLNAKNARQQLALFPIDVGLLASARRGSSEHLSSRVEEAMSEALFPLPLEERQRAERLVDASRAVVGSLAALMVRDKFLLEEGGLRLFEQARERFPGYFDWVQRPSSVTQDELINVLSTLGDGVNYEGLDPSVVSEVYETAVVSQSDRLQLGIFYTPPDLARQIALHVPFEAVAPDERIVLDPACGSGTLLLAAYDRLQALAPATWDPLETHTYLVSHLAGYDMDQFAVEIAKLSLLLNALPEGNSWKIEQQDTLRSPNPRDSLPSVVISNPPWRDERSRSGVRRQLADDFLERMLQLVKPGGFLAVVLPVGWLSSASSRSARQLVQEQTDIFEVWRLPEGTFGSSTIAPCVLLAQAKPPRRRPWVYRRVTSSQQLHHFFDTGVADEQYLAQPGTGLRRDSLLRGPLDAARENLSRLPQLRSLAAIQNGPVPEPPVSERGGAGDFLWLRRATDLPAFGEPPDQSLMRVRFPDDFHRAGTHDGAVFLRHKLLASAKKRPENPWRLKVGIDRRGVIPRESLYMIIPSSDDEDILYALLAILSSTVASCWIDSYETKMAIDAGLLGDMPIPAPGAIWKGLARMGRVLAAVAAGFQFDPAIISSFAQQVDQAVTAAYGLPADVVQHLRRHFGGFDAPEGRPRYARSENGHVAGGPEAERFGAVLDVVDDHLRLWVPGMTQEDGDLLPLPERFLGWHCDVGASFEVLTSTDDLLSARYRFQRRSYQEFDQPPGDKRIDLVS